MRRRKPRLRSRGTLQPERETDLYAPAREFLAAQGYTVRGEAHGCDVAAVKGEDLVIVELKLAFNAALLVQAARRQRLTASVYVALPEPVSFAERRRWRGYQHLLRRLELGLLWVSFAQSPPRVKVVFHPLPCVRRRRASARRALLHEVAGRSGDFNAGGCTRRKLLTAYREEALFVACVLARCGESAPRAIRARGGSPRTRSILASNFYGWFERVAFGVYALTETGRKALAEYAPVIENFRPRLEEQVRAS